MRPTDPNSDGGATGALRSRTTLGAECLAPFSSMYLDPQGGVGACCQNKVHRLGFITRQSLTDIWRGPAAARLRHALSAGDFRLGCELCQSALESGGRQTALLRAFDDLDPSGAEPAWPVQLEFALSNSCNLQCVMCNGDLSSSIRIHREGRSALPVVYDDAFFDELDDFLPHLQRAVFLGGEPFLAAETTRVLDRLVELGLQPNCHVTTNGTVWNERVERVVSTLPVHVAVSVDGASAKLFESIRVGADHAQVMRNLEAFRVAVGSRGGMSLSVCLMVPNHSEFVDILHVADRLDVDVFVNTVTHPPEYSFQHLSTEQLSAAVATMRSQEGRAERLGRNLGVWRKSIAWLEALTADRHLATPVVLLPAHGGDVGALLGAARAAAASGSSDLMAVTTGAERLIDTIDVDHWDLGADALIGAPMQSLLEAIVARFGDLISSEVEYLVGGVERRRMLFGGPPRSFVTAAMAITPDGQQHWFISVDIEHHEL